MNHFAPLDFSVKYQLGEYLSFLQEHILGTVLPQRIQIKPPTKLQAFFYRVPLSVIGSVLFLFKSSRVGICRFTVDQANIIRRSKRSELVLPWSEVISAHRYTAGYLITKKEGSVPIPYRVLSREQRAHFENLVAPFIAVASAT